jgi:hypothetical protein
MLYLSLVRQDMWANMIILSLWLILITLPLSHTQHLIKLLPGDQCMRPIDLKLNLVILADLPFNFS